MYGFDTVIQYTTPVAGENRSKKNEKSCRVLPSCVAFSFGVTKRGTLFAMLTEPAG